MMNSACGFTTVVLLLQNFFGMISSQQLINAASSPVEMVVSANNLATDAGKKILAAGGSAVDAMIAVQAVLGLVEPQSSGIAGGAFVVYYDAATKKLTTFDAREKAPANATETRFQNTDGTTLGFFEAWQSALSVGVPGVPKLMESLHSLHGKLNWAELFDDAKVLATDGFSLTQRTEDLANALLRNTCEGSPFFRDPEAFSYFINEENCTAKSSGTLVTNPEYAETLESLAEDPNAFYTGAIADDIITKLQGDLNPTGDAVISLQDLLDYEVIEREPVCKTYRNMYNVCGMGPPSSGGLAVGQIFGIMDNFNFTAGPQDVETVHLFTQAMRLAFADRNAYVGDSDFVTVPVEGMLNTEYLQERSTLISSTADMGTAVPGVPPGAYNESAPQIKSFDNGTSHISIVDQFGNALSMTTTIESPFGNGVMVRGFLLNNELTDFSFSNEDENGTAIANRVQAGKRPRSSMSPTIVFDMDGNIVHLAGSPGGSSIIGYTAQALLLMIDFDFDPQKAANTPHYQNRNGQTNVEAPISGITTDFDVDTLEEELTDLGHDVNVGIMTSGLSLITIDENGLFMGGADPRRDGTAGGRSGNTNTTDTQSPTTTNENNTLSPPTIPVVATSSPSLSPVTSQMTNAPAEIQKLSPTPLPVASVPSATMNPAASPSSQGHHHGASIGTVTTAVFVALLS